MRLLSLQTTKILLVHPQCEIIFIALHSKKYCLFQIIYRGTRQCLTEQQLIDYLRDFAKNITLLSSFSYRSSNLAIAMLSLLISFLIFLYWGFTLVYGFFSAFLPIYVHSFRSFNYCDIDSCRSFSHLKAEAKSNEQLLLSPLKSMKSGIYQYRSYSLKIDNFRK